MIDWIRYWSGEQGWDHFYASPWWVKAVWIVVIAASYAMGRLVIRLRGRHG